MVHTTNSAPTRRIRAIVSFIAARVAMECAGYYYAYRTISA